MDRKEPAIVKTVYAANSNMKQYGDLELSRGQIFALRGLMNDKKLLDHGYVVEVDNPDADFVQCLGCGRKFIDAATRDAHARNNPHPAVDLSTGPLKQPRVPKSGANLSERSDDGDQPLETEEHYLPSLAEEGVAADKGSKRKAIGNDGSVKEVFSLGGGEPRSI